VWPNTEAVACEDLFAEGAGTSEAVQVAEETGCLRDGEVKFPGLSTMECADGTTLYWSNDGWGYIEDTWHPNTTGTDEFIAPETELAACRG
jgi:hypothetical protein